MSQWWWLTGATGGLGRALAQQYAAKGQSLLLSARDPAALADLAATLPGEHACLAFDLLSLRDAAARESLLTALQPYLLQGIRGAIFNAGQSQRGYVLQTQLAVEEQLMWVNFHAQTVLTRLLLPYLLQQSQAELVFIASMAGRLGSPGRAGYSAAKHALTGWANSLRHELPSSLRVRLVSPDFIATGIAASALTADGSLYTGTDTEIAKGQSAEQMAARMVNALAGSSMDIRLCSPKVRLADWVHRLSPNSYHRWLPKFYRRHF